MTGSLFTLNRDGGFRTAQRAGAARGASFNILDLGGIIAFLVEPLALAQHALPGAKMEAIPAFLADIRIDRHTVHERILAVFRKLTSFHFSIKQKNMFDGETESATGCRGEMRSISEARRDRAPAAADRSKLHGYSFDLEIE
jgi:hypothetical protein